MWCEHEVDILSLSVKGALFAKVTDDRDTGDRERSNACVQAPDKCYSLRAKIYNAKADVRCATAQIRRAHWHDETCPVVIGRVSGGHKPTRIQAVVDHRRNVSRSRRN